jgi:hypothetical protein
MLRVARHSYLEEVSRHLVEDILVGADPSSSCLGEHPGPEEPESTREEVITQGFLHQFAPRQAFVSAYPVELFLEVSR